MKVLNKRSWVVFTAHRLKYFEADGVASFFFRWIVLMVRDDHARNRTARKNLAAVRA